jgi:hypothetical protein
VSKKGGKASGSSAPPSEYDWGVALLRFRILRELQDPGTFRRATRLPKLLEREAAAIYAIANQLDRKGTMDAELEEHTSEAIWVRIALRGYGEDYIAIAFVGWALSRDSPGALTRSSATLRRHAAVVEDIAEQVQRAIDYYLVEASRRRRGETGRYPSVAMDFLVEAADRWGASDDELAHGLVEDGALPESERSEESDDPVEHWKMLLKKARQRSRRRRGTKHR